jgi:hypothetical protein
MIKLLYYPAFLNTSANAQQAANDVTAPLNALQPDYPVHE